LKFKVDKNLPTEYASILREAGFEADTVSDEKLSGAGDSVLFERSDGMHTSGVGVVAGDRLG
jgi:predicted nuclease of predicted toxin-antitoxin system